MRIGLTVGCIWLSWGLLTCSSAEPPRTSRKAEPIDPAVAAALREAGEIALKQDEHQHYWSDRVLLEIGDVQIRAGDFEGAERSIVGSGYDYGRNAGLVKRAEGLARAGNEDRASEVLRRLGSDHGWRHDYVHDGVQLAWLEHLISSGDFDRAGKSVEQLKSQRYRPDGLRKLAAAYSQAGNAARAAEYFTLAVDAATGLKEDYDRARALWEIADAQRTAGAVDAAHATIRRLVETVETKDPWANVAALRESAVVAAKANDAPTARRLFRRAIEAHQTVDAMNTFNALEAIAVAQAGVGYVDDALETAALIAHSEQDFTQDGKREASFYAVAVAQLKADDVAGALRTALSVKHYLQYRDDALQKIVDHQIAKRDLKSALTTAEKIGSPSRRATAILKVATAYARSDDRKTAADVAAGIELVHRDTLFITPKENRFDYRAPRTWGFCYDAKDYFTMASHRQTVEHAAELAAAAMSLAQALGQPPAESYAVLFNDDCLEVTQALARAHAASGDANEALAWARQIGGSGKVPSKEDHDAARAVERRIHALIGVAEGVLERRPGPAQ